MPNDDLIRDGTASVTNGQVTIAGQGVSWGKVVEGDFFGAHRGLAVPIASIAGSTLTLAYAWPGATQAAAPYAIQPKGDVTRFQDRVRQLLEALADGTLASLAQAGSSADKLAYYTGAGTAALANVTAHARALLGLSGGAGKIIRSTGAATAVMQDIVGTVSQASGVPTGAIVERGSNANGEYVRFADGTQICTRNGVTFTRVSDVDMVFSWTYPAAFVSTPSGTMRGPLAQANISGVSFSDLGFFRHTDTATGGQWAISRTAGAPNFPAGSSVRGCALIAIGRWF